MYDHPQAKPAQLKEATLQISRDIWNKYYALVFKKQNAVLLGIYSHMIHSFLYLPDYPMGHLIAHQIDEQVKKSGKLGEEIERMAKLGNIAPDLWMKQATGAPVGAEALLEAAKRSLQEIRE
jgi:oligoendopeptidase F